MIQPNAARIFPLMNSTKSPAPRSTRVSKKEASLLERVVSEYLEDKFGACDDYPAGAEKRARRRELRGQEVRLRRILSKLSPTSRPRPTR
jgi:hypothetical protein